MAEMKNICGKIPMDLHEKVREEIELTESSTIMEVQAESDMISNYIEMYHLAPAKYMNQKHWLAVPMDGTVRDSKVLDMLDMGYDIVDEQEK